MHVFWDIDNKSAKWTRPEDLVENIYASLLPLGEIAGICAYGNRHTFTWVAPVERARRKEIKDRSGTLLSCTAPVIVRCMVSGAYWLMRGMLKPVSVCCCSWNEEPTSESGAPIELCCTVCGARAQTPAKLEEHFR